ncbi:MAG: hypothetical protein LBD76_05630 [Prevotellaceae bacterium]|nr:hypothetical protein [Prevotellaceae bacterium]
MTKIVKYYELPNFWEAEVQNSTGFRTFGKRTDAQSRISQSETDAILLWVLISVFFNWRNQTVVLCGQL